MSPPSLFSTSPKHRGDPASSPAAAATPDSHVPGFNLEKAFEQANILREKIGFHNEQLSTLDNDPARAEEERARREACALELQALEA